MSEQDKVVPATLVKAKPVERGFFRAVFGDIFHPDTHTRFTLGALKEHIVDAWIKVQEEAGKITRGDPEPPKK